MWAISASPLVVTTPIMNCTDSFAASRAPLDTCNVTLVRQNSHDSCTLGSSYGCFENNHSMWTDNGCRGVFTCDGRNVTCDGDGQHICGCGPVECTPTITDLQKEILFNDE